MYFFDSYVLKINLICYLESIFIDLTYSPKTSRCILEEPGTLRCDQGRNIFFTWDVSKDVLSCQYSSERIAVCKAIFKFCTVTTSMSFLFDTLKNMSSYLIQTLL